MVDYTPKNYLIPIYVCRPGIDFILPEQLYCNSLLLNPNMTEAIRYFEFVADKEHAEYYLFPFDLTIMIQQIGITATAQMLRSNLTDFDTFESRYILKSCEDTSLPLEINSIIFQVSLNSVLHDRNAIAMPYFVDDPLVDGDLKLSSLFYHSSFVGHPSSHPMRVYLADLLSREHRLQQYVETTSLHHGHIPPEEQKIRKEHFNKILCQSLTVLCPRGAGENTIRFFETLAHGRIPVLISDHAVLPLKSVIPYDDFVIRVPEDRLAQVADYILAWLGCRSEQQITAACEQARDSWYRWLRWEQVPALVAHELTRIKHRDGLMDVRTSATANGLPQGGNQVNSPSTAKPESEPLVSAIVSTYASAQFLLGCIEDLEQQTIADQLEIIVIDSASPQNEGEIVRELQGRYSNIRYLRTEQRETVYAAWNRGIAMARGRYLTNANTDDRHRRDAFELMVKTLESLPEIDLVYADVLVTQVPNQTFDQHTACDRYEWHRWDRNVLLDTGCFIGPQPMWRRSVHELYGGFDASYVTSGDYEFWLRISQTSQFQHIAQPLGLYLARPDSIEHANESLKQQENDRLRRLYRNAARRGEIVGLSVVDAIRRTDLSNMTPTGSEEIASQLDILDRLLDRYRDRIDSQHIRWLVSARKRLFGQAGTAVRGVENYLNTVQRIILNTQDWYLARKTR